MMESDKVKSLEYEFWNQRGQSSLHQQVTVDMLPKLSEPQFLYLSMKNMLPCELGRPPQRLWVEPLTPCLVQNRKYNHWSCCYSYYWGLKSCYKSANASEIMVSKKKKRARPNTKLYLYYHFTYTKKIQKENFLNFVFNWSITALQWGVGFCHISTWLSHTHTRTPSLLNLHPSPILSHPSRLSQGMGWAPRITQQLPIPNLSFSFNINLFILIGG